MRLAATLGLITAAGCSFQPVGIGGTDGGVAEPDVLDLPPGDCLARWRAGVVRLGDPVVLANLDSDREDRDPTLSVDERVIVFTSRRDGTEGSDLLFSAREDAADDFGGAIELGDLNSSADEGRLGGTPDQLTVVFATSRGGGEGGFDLVTSTRDGLFAPFSMPSRTGLELINDGDDQQDPELSRDGLRLYFAAERSGHQVIALAERAAPGAAFGEPTVIVESGDGDADPAVSNDERVLVFSSNRDGAGRGGGNLWYAARAATGDPFGEPRAVPTVNSDANDGDPVLSADGCRLYFASDRGATDYALYVAPVILE